MITKTIITSFSEGISEVLHIQINR